MHIRDIIMGASNPIFDVSSGNWSGDNYNKAKEQGGVLKGDNFKWAFMYVYDKKQERIIPFEPIYTDRVEDVEYRYTSGTYKKRVLRILIDKTREKMDSFDKDRYTFLFENEFRIMQYDGYDILNGKSPRGAEVYYETIIDGKKFLFSDEHMFVEFGGNGYKKIKGYAHGNGGHIVCTLGFDGNVGVWAVLNERWSGGRNVSNGMTEIYSSNDIIDVKFVDNRNEYNRARKDNALIVVINGREKSAIICYDKAEYNKEDKPLLYEKKVFENSIVYNVGGKFTFFIVQSKDGKNMVYRLGHDKITFAKNLTAELPNGKFLVFGEIISNSSGTVIYSIADKKYYLVDNDLSEGRIVINRFSTMISVPTDVYGENFKHEPSLYYDEDARCLSTILHPSYMKYNSTLTKWQKDNYAVGYYMRDGYHPIPKEFNVIIGVFNDGVFTINKNFPLGRYIQLDIGDKALKATGNIIEINQNTIKDLLNGRVPKSDYI